LEVGEGGSLNNQLTDMDVVQEFELITGESSQFVKKYFLAAVHQDNVVGLLNRLEQYDRPTYCHSIRVLRLAMVMCEGNVYGDGELKAIAVAALLHDVGKICIPVSVIKKPGKLTMEEWRVIRMHPFYGAVLLQGLGFSQEVVRAVLQHHERLDGSGYPLGLTRTEMYLPYHTIAIADVYDAITVKRPYNTQHDSGEAIEIIRSTRGLYNKSIDVFLERLGA